MAARRQFQVETGLRLEGPFEELGTFRQPSGKMLSIWAIAGECDPKDVRSNAFELELPPHYGKHTKFPATDWAGWFSVPKALQKISMGQRPVIEALANQTAGKRPAPQKQAVG